MVVVGVNLDLRDKDVYITFILIAVHISNGQPIIMPRQQYEINCQILAINYSKHPAIGAIVRYGRARIIGLVSLKVRPK